VSPVKTPVAKTRRYWGTQRIARVCQVTPATVANWIDQGHMKGHRTPTGHRRVEKDDLIEFLKAHDIPVPPDVLKNGREVVVVVEDDPAYLRALVKHLQRSELDADVVAATNGMDALLEIGRRQPGVVILDYHLPDLNADALIERLKEPGSGFDAEVIVVSGGLPEGAEERLRRVGAPAVVNKGVGIEVVVQAVKAALGR
jgi:excisionase family DNA binding protein